MGTRWFYIKEKASPGHMKFLTTRVMEVFALGSVILYMIVKLLQTIKMQESIHTYTPLQKKPL